MIIFNYIVKIIKADKQTYKIMFCYVVISV